MDKYSLKLVGRSEVEVKNKIVNKVLVCVEKFAMFEVGDSLYCYAIDNNNKFVGYSRRHDFEFRISLELLNHFRLE